MPGPFGQWVEIAEHPAIDLFDAFMLAVVEGQPVAAGHAVKGGVFFQQEPGTPRVYLFPGQAVPVDAGGKAPAIAEVTCLIDIAAFPHDAIGQRVEEQIIGVGFRPAHKGRYDKASKVFRPVAFGQETHLADFDIVRGCQPVPWENLADSLQGLVSPAQHYHAAKAAFHEKAQIVPVDSRHDLGIVVAANEVHRCIPRQLPHIQPGLRANLARSPTHWHSPSCPPGGWS